jgi:hypothetical protein
MSKTTIRPLKVKIYPNILKNKHWQVNISPEYRQIGESYAFLANNHTIRPQFDKAAYQYNFGPISNRYTQEEVDTLVKKLGFNDEHTNAKLTSADSSNRLDPFFTHKNCKAKLGRDVTTLDLRNPLDELVYAIMSADPMTIIGENNLSKHPTAEWIIADEEADALVRESKREKVSKLHNRFEALTKSQKRNMAIALGIKLSGEEKDVIVEDLLYSKITENSSKETLTSIQDLFIELSDPANKAKLELTVTVEKLFQYAILRKENTKVLFNGEQLSTDTIHIVDFLAKPENSALLLTLEEALKAKSK